MTFESLYNWDIQREWAKNLNKVHINKLKQDKDLHFLQVIHHLTELHTLVIRCENFDQAEFSIDQLLTQMSEFETVNCDEKLISTKVVSHVVHATIQKSLENMDLFEKAKEFEKKVIPLDTMTDIELSTLYGIRSFCLNHYYTNKATENACNFAEKAVNLNPDCSYWNLAYAQCLRKIRHKTAYYFKKVPCFLEKKYFEIAYTQNTHPYFGIRLAFCYKESRENGKAVKMLSEVKQLPIQTPYIWQQLAVGFIHYNKFELAKECLDEAEKIDDSSPMLHYYKGLYYMKGCKNYDEAMIHLKKASDRGYHNAFMNYLCCIYHKNPEDRRVLELMEGSTPRKTYDRFKIRLTIALYYGKNLHDYEKSLIELSETVKPYLQDPYLIDFFYFFADKFTRINIYHYIETELLPKSRSILDPKNSEAWKAYSYLKKLAKINKLVGNNFSYN